MRGNRMVALLAMIEALYVDEVFFDGIVLLFSLFPGCNSAPLPSATNKIS
jgi:hypothetical protein